MTRAAVFSPALVKEVRALLPMWGATVAAVATGFLWRGKPLDIPLFAYVTGAIAIGAHSVGQEYGHRTLSALLSQPVNRRRVYLLKFVVSATMLLLLAALAWNALVESVGPETMQAAVVFPVLCGLFLAPLMTMICRSSIAGMILSGTVPALTWMLTLAIAWFWFGVDTDAAGNIILDYFAVGMIVVCPVVGVFGWRRFTQLEADEVASPALHLPRWLKRAQGIRRQHPLTALAAKEVHLQQIAFVVAGLNVVGWAIVVLLQRYIPSLATFPVEAVVVLYGAGVSIMIGALASGEERHHGTLDWQLLQPVSSLQQWMVKVGVAFGLAFLLGVSLPALVIQATARAGFAGFSLYGHLAVSIVLLTASSIYISSLSTSGVRAMVLTLPAGIAAILFIQMVRATLWWATLKLGGPLIADVVTGRTIASPLDATFVPVFTVRVFLLTVVPALLWFGFINHTSLDRSPRRILLQILCIALLIATGIILTGGVLAFYEWRGR